MQISEGQTLTREFEVQDRHTAAHIGSGTVKVLATPVMIAFIEITALELMGQSLEEGYTSVGTRLDIRHLAPSPDSTATSAPSSTSLATLGGIRATRVSPG